MKEPKNTLDKKFQVLSNRTRREILMRLNQESHSAGEIAGYFQITPASISYHLSLLQKEWVNFLLSSRKAEDISSQP